MSERIFVPTGQSDDSKERQTVINETPSTLFPAEPTATPRDDSKDMTSSCSIGPRPMSTASQAPVGQPGSQPQGRGPKPHPRQGVAQSPDLLLTVEEFAEQLRVSRACVRKWILTRRVGVVKVGRLVRIRSSELRRIIDEGSQPRLQSP